MSRLNLFSLIVLVLLSANACSDDNEKKRSTGVAQTVTVSDASQNRADSLASFDNKLIAKAKQITADYKLSPIKQACLTYEVQEKKFEGKRIIDVREVHSETCGGDTGTTPRLFSIAIVEETGEIWSDAKSMLGQLEKLEQL